MATSPQHDATLVSNLKRNVTTLRDALEQERACGDHLAASVLELVHVEPPDHHTHVLGDPKVCCAVIAAQQTPQVHRRAVRALDAWQAVRTGDRASVKALTAQDPQAKFVGKAYDPKEAG